MKPLFFILAASLAWAQFPVDSRGIIITGLPAAQDNLLGPLIPSGNSPWLFGDLAEIGIAQNMAPAALAEAPTLGTALPGTGSWTQGSQTITTTVDLTSQLAGKVWVVYVWTSVDGAGTGRMQCPIQSVTATTITCSENHFEPDASGVTGYLMPPADIHGWDFTSWTTENPVVTWNYYDVAIGLYRLYYRTGNATYLTQARAYADIQWQWTLDHGYRRTSPRASALISQFFRAGEGHSERFPGLYDWISMVAPSWLDSSFCPACDNREGGYMLWALALGAKTDTDPTRHAQYCTWLNTYTPGWNGAQAPDGSWPEEEYAINAAFVAAPKVFSAPFLYLGSPWREAINIKAMQAIYESLNDTSGQGCNNPTLAAATLTVIAKAVNWQNNYGRSTANRGVYYEVNSQSDDQQSVSPATGTVSVALSSTSVLGVGTGWSTAGYCDGTHFIGIRDPLKVYKIASCTDNTHATLTTPFGLYGEVSNVSGSAYGIAPAASASCGGSLASYCNSGIGDRNLNRTTCGGMGWLYSVTLNQAYKTITEECLSASLGGPTAGLTGAATIGSNALPCSGAACDGLVTDTVAAAANCGDTGGVTPCVNGSYLYSNLGKNFGEAFGAPGIDNALAWLNWAVSPASSKISGKALITGKAVIH